MKRTVLLKALKIIQEIMPELVGPDWPTVRVKYLEILGQLEKSREENTKLEEPLFKLLAPYRRATVELMEMIDTLIIEGFSEDESPDAG